MDFETGTLPEGFKFRKRRTNGQETPVSRKKRLLSVEEMWRVEGFILKVFQYISSLKEQDALAECIQYSKIPPDLSESAVVHLRHRLFPGSLDASLGGKHADVLVQYSGGKKRVEVKATGEWKFQRLSKRDTTADYLVWINFGSYFRKGKGKITVYKLTKPGDFFTEAQLVWLDKFLKVASGDRLEELTGPSLAEIIKESRTN